MPKAVIFDVDGTLIDSVDLHAKAWQDAFAEYGRDVPFDDIRGQIGKGGDQLMPVFLSEDDIEAFGEELEERRGTILKERYLPKVRAFPGVRALFEHLRAERLDIALASSAKEDELGPRPARSAEASATRSAWRSARASCRRSSGRSW